MVKELVENAIDAGSSQIIIEIEEAGLKKIQITDNGHGIAHDEVELALRRHATSKIKNQADLFRIRTLGFRGEALPSIASVSVLTLLTAVDGASHGTKLVARGGEVEEVIPATSPVGTKVCAEDLFFNTPARLKYMKSQQAELSHIIDIVNRLGLAHPEISFSLISDGKEMTRTAGTGQLRQAIAGIYGLVSAKKMIEIENSDLDFEITGFVSLPELTRANRNYISLFINGRYIKNFLLNRAILDGYGSKLMVGRFPLAVIHIHIDPYLADVNVFRSLCANLFYRLMQKISPVALPSGVRDFRMMRRSVVDAILTLTESNRFSKGLFAWVGFKTHYLDYPNVERQAGKTSWSFRQLFFYSIEGILNFSDFPLSIAFVAGLLSCFLSFFQRSYSIVCNY